MPESWSSQRSDDPDDFHAWLVRRNSHVALRSEADNIARNLWNQSTQNGGDLYAGNPSDLANIGLTALDGKNFYLTAAANNDGQGGDDGALDQSPGDAWVPGGHPSLPYVGSDGSRRGSPISSDSSVGPNPAVSSTASYPSVSELEVIAPSVRTRHLGLLDSLNHNPAARVAGEAAGYLLGLPAGVGRAGWHALEGVGHGLNFTGGLIVSSNARAKAWDDTQAAAHNALQYGRSVLANPSRLADDALSGAKAANRSLNPFATPIPDTASGAFGHELGIGANGGETLTNIVGLVAAPEVAGGINAARTFAATREANVAKMMGQGLDEPTARYLSKPYKGQGDHAVIQKSQESVLGFETPWLKKAPIPKWLMDSPLNVSRPRGLSQGDFYEYHYGVDSNFYGGKLPPRLNGGKGWSGNRLGLERYSGPRRTWARIPPIWKDYYAGVTLDDALRQLPQNPPQSPQ